jgi:eukaryotic-like serine/threonine-protein kinase
MGVSSGSRLLPSTASTTQPPRHRWVPCAEMGAAPGTTLLRHHFDRLPPSPFKHPLVEFVAHPTDAGIFGLRNRSTNPCQVTLRQGQQLQVDRGRSCNFAATDEIVSHDGLIRIDP